MEPNSNQRSDQKAFFREWLEKLQQESWQLELLISGFAIFGIYAFRSVLKDIEIFQNTRMSGEVAVFVNFMVFILKKGWLIFFINLIIHVLLRGLWIGAIGLRYVSGDIDFDGFRYEAKFNAFLKRAIGSYDDFIENLEKICSVIFAYTFLLFLLFTSMMVFFIQFVLFIYFGQKLFEGNTMNIAYFSTIGVVYLLGGFIVFTDFITLGGFKKIKDTNFSKIYYYIYRFYSITTLSFLYRPLIYNFIDNSYTKKLFYFSIPYIALIIFGPSLFVNNTYGNVPSFEMSEEVGLSINEDYYDDLRAKKLEEYPNEERKLNKGEVAPILLEKFNVSGNFSSFFISIDNNFSTLVEKKGNLQPFFKKGISFAFIHGGKEKSKEENMMTDEYSKKRAELISRRRAISKALKSNPDDDKLKMNRDSINLAILEKETQYDKNLEGLRKGQIKAALDAFLSFVTIKVDSTELNLENCYFYNHPYLGNTGIKCFFKTDSLENGIHQLYFSKLRYLSQEDTTYAKSLILPFIKQ